LDAKLDYASKKYPLYMLLSISTSEKLKIYEKYDYLKKHMFNVFSFFLDMNFTQKICKVGNP